MVVVLGRSCGEVGVVTAVVRGGFCISTADLDRNGDEGGVYWLQPGMVMGESHR